MHGKWAAWGLWHWHELSTLLWELEGNFPHQHSWWCGNRTSRYWQPNGGRSGVLTQGTKMRWDSTQGGLLPPFPPPPVKSALLCVKQKYLTEALPYMTWLKQAALMTANLFFKFIGYHCQNFLIMLFSYCRQFLDNLRNRLQEWGPAHCMGEIFIKFGSQLNTYTNFFSNYPVILKTIDKVNDWVTIQAFIKPSELEGSFVCNPKY